MSEIRAVSNRNNFTPLTELVELYARSADDRDWLMRFAKSLMATLSNAYVVACNSAMEQAGALLVDPNYAEKKRKRAAASRKQTIEKNEAERKQRLLETIDPEEILKARARKLLHIEQMMRYHRESLERYKSERDGILASHEMETTPSTQWDKAGRA